MDKTTSDIAPQTSDVKEEMGLKWIKNISDIAPQTSDVKEEMGLK